MAIFLAKESKNNLTWIEIYTFTVSKTPRCCWCVEFCWARLNFALIFRQIDERQDDRWIEPSLMQIKCQNLQMHNINLGSKNLVSEAFKNHNIKLKQRAWNHLSRATFSRILFQICCPRNYFTRFSSGRISVLLASKFAFLVLHQEFYSYFQFVVPYCVGLFKYVFQSESFRLLRRYG